DGRGECERRDVADRRRAEEVEELRHDRGLFGDRDREDTGRPRTERDEADVAEREHAGVADEEVQRDDDRDVDEGVDEARRRRVRDEGPKQSRGDDEHDRPAELHECCSPPHTRSTAVCPDRVKRPPGRMRRTRITAAKRNEGRYWLWFVGSAPPSRPEAKP